MKKSIIIYAQVSAAIAFFVCILVNGFYILAPPDAVGGDYFIGPYMAYAYTFTFYNGFLLAIAGCYLLSTGYRKPGWISLIIVLLFYVTVFLVSRDHPGGP